MAQCPICLQPVDAFVSAVSEGPSTECCPNCGTQLIATMWGQNGLLAFFSAIAILIRSVTLPFNPRANPQKTSALAFALQSLLVRLLWRTGFVRLKPSPHDRNKISRQF